MALELRLDIRKDLQLMPDRRFELFSAAAVKLCAQ
jgi:hypothetical protein